MDNIFKNMTKEELKNFIEECGINTEFTEEGRGGFFINGKQISNEDFINLNKESNKDM